MRLGVRRRVPDVDDDRARLRCRGRERLRRERPRHLDVLPEPRARPVDLAHPREVHRCARERRRPRRQELLLAHREQRVGHPLLAERRRVLLPAAGGAERSPAVRRVQHGVVGQVGERALEGLELVVREVVGELGPREIAPRRAAHDQRPAAEQHGSRVSLATEHVRDVLRRVTRRGQDLDLDVVRARAARPASRACGGTTRRPRRARRARRRSRLGDPGLPTRSPRADGCRGPRRSPGLGPSPHPGTGGPDGRDRSAPHDRRPPRTRYEPLPSPASRKSWTSIPDRG